MRVLLCINGGVNQKKKSFIFKNIKEEEIMLKESLFFFYE